MKTIRDLAAALVLCFTVLTEANTNEWVKGLDQPLEKIKVDRPDVEYMRPQGTSFQTCHVYPDFVVVALDIGEFGESQIAVRPRKKKQDVNKLCEARDWPQEILLQGPGADYFIGAKDKYLFTISGDVFGNLASVWVHDPKTGKPLFEAKHSTTQDLNIKEKSGKVSLSFYAQVEMKCSFEDQSNGCWVTTLDENKIPSSVKLEKPDCSQVFESESFKKSPMLRKDPAAIQVFAPAEVADVAKPKLNYVDGKATCNQTP